MPFEEAIKITPSDDDGDKLKFDINDNRMPFITWKYEGA
jgi:hypothetical protein